MGRHKTCPYIGWIPCRGNPRGCPTVGRFWKIDTAVSRYESRPTQAQEADNYPGGLEWMERRSPFPTNDSVLCRGRRFRREQRSLFPTTAKCRYTLANYCEANLHRQIDRCLVFLTTQLFNCALEG